MMFSVLEVLPVLSEKGFSPFSYGPFSNLLIIDIYFNIVLALIASFPTNLVPRIRSPNAEVVVVLVF